MNLYWGPPRYQGPCQERWRVFVILILTLTLWCRIIIFISMVSIPRVRVSKFLFQDNNSKTNALQWSQWNLVDSPLFHTCTRVPSRFCRVRLCVTLWTVARQAPLPMGFSRQEYWSGLPCPPPGNLSDPGIEPTSLMSPALVGGFFTTSTDWKPVHCSTAGTKTVCSVRW